MRKLSLWAKYNPQFARIIIVVSHILLIIIASKLAIRLSAGGTHFSLLWTCFFFLLFIAIALLYPKKINRREWYIKQKTCDIIAGFCSFCLVCCFVNQLDKNVITQTANAYNGTGRVYKNPSAEKLLQDFKNGQKSFFSRKEKRIIKDEFRYQLKQYVKAKVTGNKGGAEEALLIFLSCIAALGLLALVASLACSLACDGANAAAVIVAILGTVGVIWGLVLVIKSIHRKHQKTSGSSDSPK